MSKILFLLSMFLLLAPISVANAAEVPSFPTCSNPQGQVIASYESGTHGIVGNPGEFNGKDTVYSINDVQALQCFCNSNNEGIQTLWWKVESLTQEEIEQFKKLGWQFVPNGAAWGLAQTPYLASNNTYSCSNGTGGGNSTNTGEILSSSATTSSSTDPAVLGLASTGGEWQVGLAAILSGLSFTIGLVTRRRTKQA